MKTSKNEPRPSRFLYRLGWLLALVLFLVALLAPLVDNEEEQPTGPARIVALFARDATLRRTTFASAVGLAVTASVFFRAPAVARRPAPPKAPPRPPRSVGA